MFYLRKGWIFSRGNTEVLWVIRISAMRMLPDAVRIGAITADGGKSMFILITKDPLIGRVIVYVGVYNGG
jgi:hypothetical protein